MTLRDKRRIVVKFKCGHSVWVLAYELNNNTHPMQEQQDDVERILRDYLNGKFTLEPKQRFKLRNGKVEGPWMKLKPARTKK